MKSKGVFYFMLNPFKRLAGWQAFGIGTLIILLSAYIGALSGTYFDGVLDSHLLHHHNYAAAFSCIGLSIISLIVIMSLTGVFFSKNFRFIDIAGTMILANAPSIFIAFSSFIITDQTLAELISNPFSIMDNVTIIFYTLLCIPFIIWKIILMYNAFSVSCNIKGSKNIIIFIVALIFAEILSKVLIYITYSYIQQ